MRVIANRTKSVLPRRPSRFPNSDQINVLRHAVVPELKGESAYIELKIRLAEALRQRRQDKGLSQVDLAAKLRSSQSRVAKMEAGDAASLRELLDRVKPLRSEHRPLLHQIS